jgi:hypothetical protein
VHKRVAIEHGANLGSAKREAKVSGGTLVDGINGKTTGLSGGLGENFSLEFHKVKVGGDSVGALKASECNDPKPFAQDFAR